MKPIRVAFFGSPDLAVPSLKALHADLRYEVVLVVTRPDMPVGRGQRVNATPVKLCAEELGLRVVQPPSVRPSTKGGSSLLLLLKELAVDVGVVVAYGHILRPELLESVPYGFINIHPSLLPLHRGPTPIQAALLAGDVETGVSIMLLDSGMDTGPVVRQERVPLQGTETAADLHDRMADIGARLLIEAVSGVVSGALKPVPQNEKNATICGMLKKEDGNIDWEIPHVEIERRIRAYSPWPGAFTECDGLRIQVLSAHLEDGVLVIDRVKPAGKGEMLYEDFLRGRPDCQLPPA